MLLGLEPVQPFAPASGNRVNQKSAVIAFAIEEPVAVETEQIRIRASSQPDIR
jgi:hypothetical protein